MISQAVQDAIEEVVETANFSALFDHFADDAELRVAIAVSSPGYSVHRGKRSVMSRLQSVGELDALGIDDPLDFFAGGDRIVAVRDERFAIGSGLTVRSECALVFDVHDGCISRLGIHYQLSPVVETRPSRKASVTGHDGGPTAGTRAMTIEP
jgi:hypothetical protein